VFLIVVILVQFQRREVLRTGERDEVGIEDEGEALLIVRERNCGKIDGGKSGMTTSDDEQLR
jgi:hypothetical protein